MRRPIPHGGVHRVVLLTYGWAEHGVDPAEVVVVALSHLHYDHAGGARTDR